MQLDFINEGSLEGVLTLSIDGIDYQENVAQSIKKYQKTMRFPGFRVGKTPLGLVKKQLGSELKREEINKLIQAEINKYYAENKERIIFMPLMQDADDELNWDADDTYKFTFKVAFRPEFEIDTQVLGGLETKVITLADEEIDEEIEHLREQYGDVESLDIVKDDADTVTVLKIVELNAEGEKLEEGFDKMIRLKLAETPDSLKAELIGQDNDAEFNLNLKEILSEDELCKVLGIEKPEAKDLNNNFQITVRGSIILKKAALDEAFFEKVFNDNTIEDAANFRERIADNMKRFFEDKDEVALQKEVRNVLTEKVEVPLPDAFMKEWFDRNAQLKEDDDAEKQYRIFADDTKWDLILEKLAGNLNQVVSDEEVKNSIRSYVLQQYGYQLQSMGMEGFENMVNNLYKQEYFRLELQQNLLLSKVVKELKNNGTFTEVALSKAQFEEYVRENEL
ncbi:hypothetical protein GC194_02335 [bacterium]|nr:hypothetical protein [bacterium]